jgi:hypothetical protein
MQKRIFLAGGLLADYCESQKKANKGYNGKGLSSKLNLFKVLNIMFIQNAVLGGHNVCFYASPKERQRVLFSNLKAGLDQNCSALYITSRESIEPVQAEIKDFGLTVDDSKKLRIIPSRQLYIPDGEFHISRIVEQVKGILDDSLDSGFEGLYVSSDASKVFDYITKNGMLEEWIAYEKFIGKTIPLPLEGICAYSLNQVISNSQLFLQLIQAHKNTVNTKKNEFVDNEKICINTISSELDRILGKEATELVFRFLEKRFKTPRNKILPNIVEFNQVLEVLLGDSSASIQEQFLKKLHTKLELTNLRV